MSSNRVFNQDGEPDKDEDLVKSNTLAPHVQLTPGLQALFIEQVKMGASDAIAAKFCGLLPSTVERWMVLALEEGPGSPYYEFMVEVNRWRATTQRSLILKMVSYALSPEGDPRFIPKVLTTLYGDDFKPGSKVDNRVQTIINQPKVIITSDDLKGASPEYKNSIIRSTREQMGLSASVYEEGEEEDDDEINPSKWLEDERQELMMRDELDLSDM